jgi:hypothetical protein
MVSKVAHTVDRVAGRTSPSARQRLEHQLEASILHHAAHPEQIDRRLRELDEEWDIERVLETNASIASLFGLTLALLGRRRWLLLPLVVQGFFLQHSLQGWCPPLPLLRQLGFRTSQEIEQERYALKALRGDFKERNQTEREHPGANVLRAMRSSHRGDAR